MKRGKRENGKKWKGKKKERERENEEKDRWSRQIDRVRERNVKRMKNDTDGETE